MGVEAPLTQLSESKLLAAARSGNSEAFAVLYDRHAPAAYRHVIFRCANKEIAEDVVSQAFLHIWDYLRSAHTIRSFRAFLFQTVRNIFVDQTRKRDFSNISLEKILEEEGEKEPVAPSDLLADIILSDEVETLKRTLTTLPSDYAEILTLRYLDELSIAEIATVTGKKFGAIYVSLHRGIRLLRQALVEAKPPTP